MATIGLTLNVIGEVFLAILIIRVHKKFLMEGRIDRKVKRVIRKEISYGVICILLLIAGYILQVMGV